MLLETRENWGIERYKQDLESTYFSEDLHARILII